MNEIRPLVPDANPLWNMCVQMNLFVDTMGGLT